MEEDNTQPAPSTGSILGEETENTIHQAMEEDNTQFPAPSTGSILNGATENTIAHNSTGTAASNYVCRVPEWLCSEKMSIVHLYQPSLVSIGPYHRNNPRLQEMQRHKVWSFENLITNQDERLKCQSIVSDLVGEAKRCYGNDEDVQNISNNEFSEMMLYDGCFIILVLASPARYDRDSVIWMMIQELLDDLLLVENQILLFILQKIVPFCQISELSSCSTEDYISVLSRCHNESVYWSHLFCDLIVDKRGEPFDSLLHLYYHHRFVQESSPTDSSRNRKRPRGKPSYVIHSATHLQQHGVNIRNTRKSKQLRFEDNHRVLLYVPCILMDEKIMVNMLAFEQVKLMKNRTNRNFSLKENKEDNTAREISDFTATPISDTINFIVSMFQTPKDLELLQNRGIEASGKSNEDIIKLFSMLRSNLKLNLQDNYILEECKQINRYINSCQGKMSFFLHKTPIETRRVFLTTLLSTVLVLGIRRALSYWVRSGMNQ